MNAAIWLRFLARESRGSRGRLAWFTGCLAVGVCAVVAVASLSALVEDGIRRGSRALLGGDFSVEARRPLPADLDRHFQSFDGWERTDVRELATMVSGAGVAGAGVSGAHRSHLVELKVIAGRYPLCGELELDPPRALSLLLTESTVLIAPDLLALTGLEVGEDLSVGGASFRIAGVVLREPDRFDFSLALGGPRVLLSAAGLERTALQEQGSRVQHRALYSLPGATASDLEELKKRLETELEEAAYLRFESHHEAQPTVRRGLQRVTGFLNLVALLSLLLGGLGVAQAVRAWIRARTSSVAILRCLGFRPGEILSLYLGQVVVLSALGSGLGVGLGALASRAVVSFAPGVLLAGMSGVVPSAMARGLVLGGCTGILFSLTPLLAIWRISPARVLRWEAEPLRAPRLLGLGFGVLLGGAVFGAAWLQGGDLRLAAGFTGGLLVLLLLLVLGARLVIAGASRLPRARMNPYLFHGLAALARPSAGTVGSVVVLGVGVLVLLGLWLVEHDLARNLGAALPEDAPSVFMIDIQPDQWEEVRGFLERSDARGMSSVPVVLARLSEIDGTSVAGLARDSDPTRRRRRWVLTREQRLTWMERLPDDNRLVEGELWSDPDRHEVSLEEDFARDLGVGLGSDLSFDVQGLTRSFTVTSIRSVEWESFGINFFVVVEPGSLEGAPHFRLAAARVPETREQELQDALAVAVPNVTLIRIRALLEQLVELLARLALAVRLLGSTTVVVGVAILVGAVANAAAARGREVALLKTLGLTRWGLASLFLAEHALLGVVAGLLGALGAGGLAFGFLRYVVELEFAPPWAAFPVALVLTAVLTALAGLAASARAMAVPPLATLRD